MHISINRDTFLKMLSKTQTISDKRATMPILSNVLLETQENNLLVKATNLEVGIKLICDCEVKQQGKVAISAKALFDIIRELSDSTVNLKAKENNVLEISCGSAVFHLNCADPNEFPKMMEYENIEFSVIPINELKKMIEKTIFSISHDETRPFLNGAYIETYKDNGSSLLRLVTTDGRRLSLVNKNVTVPEKLNLTKGIIVPYKGLQEIMKNFETNSGACEIAIEKNFLVLRESNTVLYMRLIDGNYPDYGRAIPKDLSIKVFIQRNLFLSSLKRISLVSDERTGSIRFSINGNKMKVYTDTSNLGDAKEDIGVECEGTDGVIDIGFNSKFIIDILSTIEQDKLTLELKDANSAGVIKPIDHPEYLYVVMPLRT